MASTYTPIATQTLGSSANSVTFSSIAGTYTDLILVANGSVNTQSGIYVQLGNGSIDTGSNYSYTYLYGTGSSAISGRVANTNYGGFVSDFSTAQGTSIIQIQNYANTSTYKTFLSRGNLASVSVNAVVSLWRSTSAVNTVKIYVDASNTFTTGSTFTLYGIKAA